MPAPTCIEPASQEPDRCARRGWHLAPLFAVCLALLAACIARPPQAELDAYLSAFAAAREANDAFLDRYLEVERRQLDLKSDDFSSFAVADADNYATAVEPPLTAMLRRAFKSVEAFNLLLVRLAQGQSWDLVKPEVDSTANSLGLLVSLVSSNPLLEAQLKVATEALSGFARILRGIEDRAEFQRVLAESSDPLVEVLDSLIEVSPVLYQEMTEEFLRERSDAFADARDADAKQLTAKLKIVRALVADWVVLLQRTRGAFLELRAASARGAVAAVPPADFAAWSEEILNGVVAVRASLRSLDAQP